MGADFTLPHERNHVSLIAPSILSSLPVFLLTMQTSIYFWLCTGYALIPDVVYTLFTLVLIFQKPKISLSGHTWTFHPAFALTFSIILFILYAWATISNSLVVYSNETLLNQLGSWYGMSLATVFFQGTLAVCYLGMMVSACVAVHRWRRNRVAMPRDNFEEPREFGKV